MKLAGGFEYVCFHPNCLGEWCPIDIRPPARQTIALVSFSCLFGSLPTAENMFGDNFAMFFLGRA